MGKERGSSDNERLRSPELREAIIAYAEHLHDMLSSDLSSMSGTGIPLDERHRIELQIQQGNLTRERQRNWLGRNTRDEETEGNGQIGPPIPDGSFLDQWVRGERKKLLILAPFGSGKSVLIASFACRLAKAFLSPKEYPEGEPPKVVPWLVRLRAWLDHRTDDFADFVFAKSQLPLGLSSQSLKRDDLDLLAKSGRLLLMFDGFDELPEADPEHEENQSRRVEARIRMRELGKDRYILASRPFDGAEAGFKSSEIHVLRELAGDGVEEFVRKKAESSAAASGKRRNGGGLDAHPLMVAWQNGQPPIKDLLSRPLLLAAWVSRVAATETVPETLTELMEVVVSKVFDRPGMPKKLTDRDRQRLGALLMPLADAGWGTPVAMETLAREWERIPQLGPEEDITRIFNLARHGGLVVSLANTFYSIKIPVTEYLVGQYLAQLCDAKTHAGDDTDQRQLVQVFRKWFWRREFDETWVFAFDRLWRGTNAGRRLATAIGLWLLRLSMRCLEQTGHSEDLSRRAKSNLRQFTCSRFVLGVLLPSARESSALGSNAQRIGRLALKALQSEILSLYGGAIYVTHIKPPWRSRLCDRMLALLESDVLSRDIVYWRRALKTVRALGASLSCTEAYSAAKRLCRCFVRGTHKDLWSSVAGTIGSPLTLHLGAGERMDLLADLRACLADTERQAAWPDVAKAIGYVGQRLNSHAGKEVLAELFPYLTSNTYKNAWEEIAWATYLIAKRLSNADAKWVLGVLRKRLGLARYNDGAQAMADWNWVFDSDGEPNALVKELRLRAANERRASGPTSQATDPKDPSAAVPPERPDMILSRLVERESVNEWDVSEVCGLLAYATAGGAERVIARLECMLPTEQDRWLAESAGLHAIRATAMSRLSTEEALGYGRRWARSGELEGVSAVLDGHAELVWFVQEFVKDGDAERVEYGVCKRNDPGLLLDPKLQCAPARIKKLLGEGVFTQTVEEPMRVTPTTGLSELAKDGGVPATRASRFVLRRLSKNGWMVAFDSEQPRFVESTIGLRLIAKLLMKPGQSIPHTELFMGDLRPPVLSQVKPQRALDKDGGTAIRRRMEELQEVMEDDDPAAAAEAREEYEWLKAESEKSGRGSRHPAVLENDRKKLQNRVNIAIDRAIASMVKPYPELAQYLKAQIGKGWEPYSHMYRDPNPPSWDIVEYLPPAR